jgi:hypothetical protein
MEHEEDVLRYYGNVVFWKQRGVGGAEDLCLD